MIAPTPFFGDRGCHVRIYEEMRGLDAAGVETRVVTFPTGTDPPGLTVRRARHLPGIAAAPLGPNWARPVLDMSLLAAAQREASDFRPHLLHAHLHEGIAIGAALRFRHRIPLVADLQGSLRAELIDHRFISARSLLSRTVGWMEAWLVRRPDCILTSSSGARLLLAMSGVPPSRVVALPDGVDLNQFRPRSPDPALVRELGLAGKRIVVFLGVLTDYQGVDLLIDAAPRLIRRCPGAHLLVMGYPNEEHYRGIVRERGLDRVVTLTGRVPYTEAPYRLALGDVAVSPKWSVTEANGKLLNYMACGLPVVAADTPVNRELLGDNGLYAPPGDAEALADRLCDLLSDPSGAAERGRSLRNRAVAEFDWGAIVARLVELYRHVLARHTLSGAPPPV